MMAVKHIIDMVSMLLEALHQEGGPKYKRVATCLERLIAEGFLDNGAKLPTHRLLADKLNVTTGTISRAYRELERTGLVCARVGDGTFVARKGLMEKHDGGFKNFVEEPLRPYDMSRNTHIPGLESAFLGKSLAVLAGDSSVLQELMLYGPEAGLARHREAGASWLSRGQSAIVNAEQVVCVNGSQHGLLCALMALARPGDTIVTEQLTYPGLISAARMLGLRLVGVAMDQQGLMPQALDDACKVNRATVLYCTPTLQNPTCGVLESERRAAIADICRRHNLLILEDEAHGVLVDDRPPRLCEFAPERSILISSLSKAVAAGLRVGYLYAPLPLINRLEASIRASCWMATSLTLELASRWIEDGTAEKLRQHQIGEIVRRKACVGPLLKGLVLATHTHSPHYWIEVPEPWRASHIVAELQQRGYLIAGSEAFAIGRAAVQQFVRASVSNVSGGDQILIDGFGALAEILEQRETSIPGTDFPFR
ncbi:aminotransferase-like domain-containing protein [Pollutimonas bauzanensis]|uniref:DNA-binding transcriptional regulator, MocR family, contains an aminotransferase domain n=1 Tax=Pollutimonas bauzanensis TaxID=658167 RepID=A0A1M5XN69_9BURK|nr:PLP-dependent aminotransferase family protein [Pollutimonas bauzanensis]SHI01277.1 DNA-binding transcriptional regulator, MocR family, contains an aminotransferase domain [Pollutimonas bauzanensis]